MIEGFEGYIGRISDLKWIYKGTQTLQMPYYGYHVMPLTDEFADAEGYKFINFGGNGSSLPM
jgi:hypothetical protein